VWPVPPKLERMTLPDLPRVLVVDDDPDLRDLLATYLGANGHAVQAVGDGVGLRAALAQGPLPDVIVLDLMLPGEDGLSLTRWVKAHWSVPVLMLSARGEEMDRVIGLEVGADDYLAKPFGPRELLARLRALMRRAAPVAPVAQPLTGGSAGEFGSGVSPAAASRASHRGDPLPNASSRFGPFVLDAAGRRLLRDGHEVNLTGAEFDLLVVLVAHPNRVLSRDTLVDMLKGYDRDPFDRSMDNRVTRLRRKIEVDPSAPGYIRTVRGEGYLFNPRGHQP
jgi:two-component system phosphate regulon response regulator OmpR